MAAIGLLLIAAAGLLAACGEAVDQPEDCRPGEYFDEANELCLSCPAIPEPECRPGCGFFIEDDERGCPVAECAEQCLCDPGQFFADDTLSCESCEEALDPPAICAEQPDES